MKFNRSRLKHDFSTAQEYYIHERPLWGSSQHLDSTATGLYSTSVTSDCGLILLRHQDSKDL